MRLVSSAFKIALGIIIAQSIIAISIPLLTRIYDAKDFALYGYLFSVSSLIGPLVFFRLDSFAAKETTNVIRCRFLPSLVYTLRYSAPVSMFAVLVGFYMFPHKEISSLSEHVVALFLILLSSYIWVFFNALSLLNARNHEYKTLGFSRVSKSISTVVAQLLFSLQAFKFSLFYGELIGRFFAVFFLFKSGYYKLKPSKLNFNYFYRKNKNELKFNFIASLLNSLSLNLIPLFIVSRYSPELAGSFFLLFKMIGAPLNVLTQSLALSYLGNVSEYIIKRKFVEIIVAIKKTTLLMAIICLFFLFFLFFAFHFYQSELFGEGWGDLSLLLLLLSPMLFGQVVFSPFSKLLVVLGYAKIQLLWDLTRLILILLLIVGSYIETRFTDEYMFNLNIAFFSGTMLVMYIIHYFISLRIITRKRDE